MSNRPPPSGADQAGCANDQCSAKRGPLSVGDHLARFVWRLFRDPLAVITLCLFVVGGVQIELARRTARRQLRAYIVVHEPALIRQSDEGLKFEVRPSFQNSGQTPAYKVFIRSEFQTMTQLKAATFNFTLDKPKQMATTSVIGPGMSKFTTTLLNRVCSAQEIAELQEGASGVKLFVWGTAWYEDAFGAKRTTNYCFHGVLPEDPKIEMIWFGYPRNNDAT